MGELLCWMQGQPKIVVRANWGTIDVNARKGDYSHGNVLEKSHHVQELLPEDCDVPICMVFAENMLGWAEDNEDLFKYPPFASAIS